MSSSHSLIILLKKNKHTSWNISLGLKKCENIFFGGGGGGVTMETVNNARRLRFFRFRVSEWGHANWWLIAVFLLNTGNF